MGVLDGLKPEKVFHFFEEISQIPRGSGNEKQVSDYLKRFAQDRGFQCIQDELYNIIIIKEATPGYEEEEPYILQGHMDMVAVKSPDCNIDMTKDPLHLCIKDGRIHAEGTSLGGDDGIAVAYILALLDADGICHPRLEMIVTTEEETGLRGAKGIDLSMLRGRQLINLDNEEEGVIITSCAGGARVDVCIPVQWEKALEQKTEVLQIHVKGLQGGHSGSEIDKGRGNANCLLGYVLHKLAGEAAIRLVSVKGGQADNAIPREADAVILIPAEEKERICAFVEQEENRMKEQLRDTDPDFQLQCTEGATGAIAGEPAPEKRTEDCLTSASTKQALSCLTALPNGVVAMSSDVKGLVQTSLNLGMMALEADNLHLTFAVRSSVDQEKEELCQRIKEIAEQASATATVKSSYPGWAYRRDSSLRDRAAEVFERMYGRRPELLAIHAGLECGLLAAKIPDLDCISIGPDMSDVHTTEESVSIDSVARVWEYLVAVLAEKKRKAAN